MPESLVQLPALDEAPRCSPWSQERGLLPAGTAIRADRLLLLDVPAPWPKPIRDHPRLLGMMDVAGNAPVATRLLATMPVDERIRLTAFRNVGGAGVRTTYAIESEEAVPDAIAAVCNDEDLSVLRRIEEPAVRRSVLVCTQGTHDVCCGSDGVRFAADVERAFPDVTVYRVSHTGGHRFAPTAMTFPDGRMWAWLATDDVDRVLGRRGGHADLAARCRGWWGAERGAQQAAEVAIFAERGWEWEDTDREVSGSEPAVTVVADGEPVAVEVLESRRVPTIACRQPGGLPAKESVEYSTRVIGITRQTPAR